MVMNTKNSLSILISFSVSVFLIITTSIQSLAQRNTLDSVKLILEQSSSISGKLYTLNVLTLVWYNRQMDSAFAVNEKTIQQAIEFKDTIELATAHFYRAKMLAGIRRYDRTYAAYKECKIAIGLLGAKKFDVLRTWIDAYSNGLILRTDNNTNNRILFNKNFLRLDSIYTATLNRCMEHYVSEKDWFKAGQLQEEILEEDIRRAWWVYSPKSYQDRLLADRLMQIQRGVKFYNDAHFSEGIANLRRHAAYYYYYGEKNKVKAEKWFRQAYLHAKVRDNKFEIAMNLNGLAYADLAQREFDSTLLKANEALRLAHQLNDVDQIMRYQQTFYDAYLAMKQGENAIPYIERYLALKDSIIGTSTVAAIGEMETRNKMLDQQKEVDLLRFNNLKNQDEKRILLLFSAGIIIVILFIFYYRNRYQRKIKDIEIQFKLKEEKERIGRDLHDSLGAQLSSISIGLNKMIDAGKNDNLLFIQSLTDRAMSELRDSLWVMDKQDISIDELEQRIHSLFWQYQKIDTPIQMEIEVQGFSGYRLPSVYGGHLFRITQEAIQNAVKYSMTEKIAVVLRMEDQILSLSITDNGRGFLLSGERDKERFGLRNMRKRAEQMKADFMIQTSPGAGTSIEVKIAMNKLSVMI